VLHKNLRDTYGLALLTEKRDSVFELVLDLAEHRAAMTLYPDSK
jgi:hypothetical protein